MEAVFNPTKISIEALNDRCDQTMSTAIGLTFTKITEQALYAEMTVSEKNCQPLGHLNGGASMAAIEIVGSMAANLVLDREKFVAVGQNIQGSHLRPALLGEVVTAVGKPLHIGRKTQLWEVSIFNNKEKMICKGSITMAVIPTQK